MTAAEKSLAIWCFCCTYDRKRRQPQKHLWLPLISRKRTIGCCLKLNIDDSRRRFVGAFMFFAASLIAGTQPRKNPWLSVISRKRTFGWRLILSNTNVFYTRRSVASRAVLFAERNCMNDWNATLWISAIVMCRPGHASPWCADVTSPASQLRKQ